MTKDCPNCVFLNTDICQACVEGSLFKGVDTQVVEMARRVGIYMEEDDG